MSTEIRTTSILFKDKLPSSPTFGMPVESPTSFIKSWASQEFKLPISTIRSQTCFKSSEKDIKDNYLLLWLEWDSIQEEGVGLFSSNCQDCLMRLS